MTRGPRSGRAAAKLAMKPVYGPNATGVAGWLGLLWLSLVFLTPGMAAWTASKLYTRPGLAALPDGVFRSVELVEWSEVAATTALCWFLAWRLSHREVWRSVEIVIAGLWVHAIILSLAEFIAVSAATGIPLVFMLETGWVGVAARTAIAALWTAYLLRSRRVARTYKPHLSSREIAQAFD
jgi:hypothetical protein